MCPKRTFPSDFVKLVSEILYLFLAEKVVVCCVCFVCFVLFVLFCFACLFVLFVLFCFLQLCPILAYFFFKTLFLRDKFCGRVRGG